jgi:organic hydroperoxide reductase OsmC/OhrA
MSDPRRLNGSHIYEARCRWRGSTSLGYENYGRSHEASAPPALASLTLSADSAFYGDGRLLNPEQLLVLAAASCQLLSFLAVAARARIDVIAYDDIAEGIMSEGHLPMRVGEIRLHPVIQVVAGPTKERILHLVKIAHRECYIASSLRSEVTVQASVVFELAGWV